MNLALATLIIWELTAMPTAETVQQYEPHAISLSTATGNKEYHYQLLKPAQIENGKKYPVVLFLHGAGERGNDNKAQLAYLPEWLLEPANREKFACYVVAPQCPEGEKWSNVDWGAKGNQPLGETSSAMKAAVEALDQTIAANPVDTKRIYLTGLSMGGYGSWDLAEREPERFAAVAPICGGGDEQHADKLIKLPIWAWHGDADDAVPVERSRRMIAAIKAAGGDPKYSELPGVGHDSWNAAYHSADGLLPWMFQQTKP